MSKYTLFRKIYTYVSMMTEAPARLRNANMKNICLVTADWLGNR